ncbi:MAG: hypothetical protein MR239_01585 [Clostridiales bacterium]|nr:hypothetical protein [Clostridiales bacterium]MDY4656020.1 hypothetical protein [Eubacteriales bacterium]
MSNKNDKTFFTFESLSQELNEINAEKKIDVKKISDIFGRVQDIKNIKKDEIAALFLNAVNVSGKDSWKFLFEVYSRFYNRKKVKHQQKIIQLINKEIEKRLSFFITSNDINIIMSSVADGRNSKLLDERLNKLDNLCKENGYERREILAYLYIGFLIGAKRNYPSNDSAINNIHRMLFVYFAKIDKFDPLFVKNIKKSFFDGKECEKFKELTYLYNGVDKELIKIKVQNDNQKNLIDAKSKEIEQLKNNILQLNEQTAENAQQIQNKQTLINELELSVKKLENLNEYNENLYKQQFISLKRNFVDKLKKELQLEIEGLEDIADTLNETKKEKLQRRIDRIYKILQKVGE